MRNKYRIEDELVYIELNGCETLIDLDDLHIADSIVGRWFMNGGYVTYQPFANGKRYCIRLHRLIMNAPEGMLVDHINRKPLNNTRENLRVVTEQDNLKNKGIYSNTKSGIKGVCWNKQAEKWRATVSGLGDGKQKHLGSFNTIEEAEEAVKAYHLA